MSTVKIEGNEYVVRDGMVYKQHADGESEVGNPEKIKIVMDMVSEPKTEPKELKTEPKPVLKPQKSKKK